MEIVGTRCTQLHLPQLIHRKQMADPWQNTVTAHNICTAMIQVGEIGYEVPSSLLRLQCMSTTRSAGNPLSSTIRQDPAVDCNAKR